MDGEAKSSEQTFRASGRNPRACLDCLNAHGEPPWADSPYKMYCVAFSREDGYTKPPNVYYDGDDCPMRRVKR